MKRSTVSFGELYSPTVLQCYSATVRIEEYASGSTVLQYDTATVKIEEVYSCEERPTVGLEGALEC